MSTAKSSIIILVLLLAGLIWLFIRIFSPGEESLGAKGANGLQAAARTEDPSSVSTDLNHAGERQLKETRRVKRREPGSPLKYATSQVKTAYAGFLKHAALGARESQLVDLLAQQAVLMGIREQRINELGLKAAHEQYVEGYQRLEDEIAVLLTPEEYQGYRVAAERARTNLVVAAFERIARRNQEPLGLTNAATLGNLIYREYKAAGVDLFFSPQFTGNRNGVTKDAILRARANVKILAEAKTFLSPSQIEALRSFQLLQLHGMVGTSKQTIVRQSETSNRAPGL